MTTAPRWSNALAAAVCGAAGIALFQFWGNATHGYIASSSLFYWWGFQWLNRDSETQHAWLVLALSVFLLARNLRSLAPLGQAGGVRPLAAMAAGLLLHGAGFVCQQPRISILGLLAYSWGVVALAGGRRWAAAAAFPIGFMVFAIPLNALDTVGFWLQMGVVRSGEAVAHLLQIPVVRSGTQLLSADGRYHYDVVAACSGIRSLMALSALSLFIGYLWFGPRWLRAAMLAACLPVIFLANVARISAIVVAAQLGGQPWGDRVHDVMGVAIFVIVVATMAAVADAVVGARPAWAARPPSPWPASPTDLGPLPVCVVVALLAAGCAAYLSYRSSLPPAERPGVLLAADGVNPAELPQFLGTAWMGRQVEPDAVERSILPPDTGFSRRLYVNLEDPRSQVLLSIVLSGRDRSSIHRPELCLVGQGWTIDRTWTHRFAYSGTGGGFEATALAVHRERGPGGAPSSEVAAYWFVGDGRIESSQGARMLRDAWSRLSAGRAPRWAYVFMMTGDSDSAGLSRIQAVLDQALPAFQPAALARSE